MFSIHNIPAMNKYFENILLIRSAHAKTYILAMYIVIYEMTDVMYVINDVKTKPDKNEIALNDKYLTALAFLQGAVKLPTIDPNVWEEAYQSSLEILEDMLTKHSFTLSNMSESMVNHVIMMTQLFLRKYCNGIAANVQLNDYASERESLLNMLDNLPDGEKKDQLKMVVNEYGKLPKQPKSVFTITSLNVHTSNLFSSIEHIIPIIEQFTSSNEMFERIGELMDEKICSY